MKFIVENSSMLALVVGSLVLLLQVVFVWLAVRIYRRANEIIAEEYLEEDTPPWDDEPYDYEASRVNYRKYHSVVNSMETLKSVSESYRAIRIQQAAEVMNNQDEAQADDMGEHSCCGSCGGEGSGACRRG